MNLAGADQSRERAGTGEYEFFLSADHARTIA
jgi:hypothetical protein